MTESPRLSRRTFGKALAAGAALSIFPGIASSTTLGSEGFSFVVLGDLHFDRLEHHDMDWLRREKPNDVRQVEKYSRITAEITPLLLAEVKARVAELPGTPFVLQLGDLVEGLCGTPELARKHCEDAISFFGEADLGVPMVFTKGNHDITGPGAEDAFIEVLWSLNAHPAIERRTDPTTAANFVLRHGHATFVVFDAYKWRPSLDWLEAAVADHSPDRGPLFFVIHPPVVPHTARLWHVFEREEHAERRARLLDVLHRHRAVVLSGHLHKYTTLDRSMHAAGVGNLMRQLSVSSVVSRVDPTPRDELVGTEAYGPQLTDLEPRFSPDTLDRRRAVLAREREHITRFEYVDVPGYAVVHVRGGGVTADIYRGVGNPVWRRVTVV